MARIDVRRAGGVPVILATLLSAVVAGCAPLAQASADPVASAGSAAAEDATARYFASIRHSTPHAIVFLRAMPKGADLHSHLSGAVYAESHIDAAAARGYCISAALAIVPPPCDTAAGAVPAARAAVEPALRNRLIDALSMRNWQPSQRSGHDQFFSSFGRFGAGVGLGGRLAEVIARAAANRVSYLELMATVDGSAARTLGMQTGWDPDLDALRSRLLAAGLRQVMERARHTLDTAFATTRSLLRCEKADADAGCAVETRILYQVARARAPQSVFAQILLGFELSRADSRVVGFNLVEPEDHPVALRDYRLHMAMIAHLRRHYPDVPVSLHAGELSMGLVRPEDLRFHIRAAIETAGARRIGHGTAIAFEDHALDLLADMRERGVLVEVGLSSAEAILGVSGADHPISLYLDHDVPVALVTDDEAVLRSDITLEFVKAAQRHALDYRTLKRMAHNSVAYSFADDSTRARLLRELDAAFSEFERAQSLIEPSATRYRVPRAGEVRLVPR
jgi:hypothetical protein